MPDGFDRNDPAQGFGASGSLFPMGYYPSRPGPAIFSRLSSVLTSGRVTCRFGELSCIALRIWGLNPHSSSGEGAPRRTSEAHDFGDPQVLRE